MIKNRKHFDEKDSLILIAIYTIGVQLILPIILSVATTIAYRSLLIEVGVNEFEQLTLAPINFGVFLIGTAILVYLYKTQLLEAIKVFNKKLIKNLATLFKLYALSMVVNVVVNIIFQYVLKITGNSANQDAVVEMVNRMPILMIITTVVFAPILEELVFRGGLYLGLISKLGEKTATIISSISFGAIHVLAQFLSTGSFQELIFIVPYAVLGYFMVLSVKKTESLMGSIVFHFINNLIATLTVLL